MSTSPELDRLLAGPVLETAPRLLGAVVRCGQVAVRLTEVEAYDGANDPGSHAFRGQTARNATMFGPPGHLYVYFTYGMHHCANIACGESGTAAGILLRAGEVIEGLDVARARRPGSSDRDLARGPARLCRALDIDRGDDGGDVHHGRVRLELGPAPDPQRVSIGPRVGLRDAADRPWRFWLTGEPSVSRYRPATPRTLGQRADLRKQ